MLRIAPQPAEPLTPRARTIFCSGTPVELRRSLSATELARGRSQNSSGPVALGVVLRSGADQKHQNFQEHPHNPSSVGAEPARGGSRDMERSEESELSGASA